MVGTLKKHSPGRMCCCDAEPIPKCPQTDPLQAQEPWLGYFDPLEDHWNWDRFLPQLYPLPPHTDTEYTKTQTTFTTTNGTIVPISHPICVVRPMDLFNLEGTFYDFTIEVLHQSNAEYRMVAPGTTVEVEEGASRVLFSDAITPNVHIEPIVWTPGTWHKIRFYAGWNTSANDWRWTLTLDDVDVYDATPGYGWDESNECGYQFYITAGQYSGLFNTLGIRNFVVTGEFNAYQ